MQRVIDDHVLAVIADELVAGARHRDARFEHALLEFPQPALAAAIGMGHQHANADAALNGGGERLLDFLAIDPEDRDVNAPAGTFDRLDDRCETGLWLDDQIQSSSSSFSSGRAFFSSFHSIWGFSFGARAASATVSSSVLNDAPVLTR